MERNLASFRDRGKLWGHIALSCTQECRKTEILTNALPSLGNHVAMVDDPSGKHPKQTTSSEAFTTSGQSANDTELQYILGPTATNDDVFGDSHPCSVCDVVSEPIDTKTEETGSSEVSVTLMQSVEHTEIEKNIQDPLLSINDFSKNIISGPTNNVTSDHTYTYSIEIAKRQIFHYSKCILYRR